jgi:hypothetical protein
MKVSTVKKKLGITHNSNATFDDIAAFLRSLGYYKITGNVIDKLVRDNNIPENAHIFTYIYYYACAKIIDGNFKQLTKKHYMPIGQRYMLIAAFLRTINENLITGPLIKDIAEKYNIANEATVFTYIYHYSQEQLIDEYFKTLQKNNSMEQ